MTESNDKNSTRRQIRDILAAMTPAERHQKSTTACNLLTATTEFTTAKVIMLYLSMPSEVDTAPLALRAWQEGKTVVVPRVFWGERHMLPIEINSLQSGMKNTGHGIREPIGGKPIPVDFIDLVVVPGLAFSLSGARLGRGGGFYDSFLAQPEFIGISCGLAFEEQIIQSLPTLDHDMPLSMLVTDRGIRRFATYCIGRSSC